MKKILLAVVASLITCPARTQTLETLKVSAGVFPAVQDALPAPASQDGKEVPTAHGKAVPPKDKYQVVVRISCKTPDQTEYMVRVWDHTWWLEDYHPLRGVSYVPVKYRRFSLTEVAPGDPPDEVKDGVRYMGSPWVHIEAGQGFDIYFHKIRKVGRQLKTSDGEIFIWRSSVEVDAKSDSSLKVSASADEFRQMEKGEFSLGVDAEGKGRMKFEFSDDNFGKAERKLGSKTLSGLDCRKLAP